MAAGPRAEVASAHPRRMPGGPAGYHALVLEGPGIAAQALVISAPACPEPPRGLGRVHASLRAAHRVGLGRRLLFGPRRAGTLDPLGRRVLRRDAPAVPVVPRRARRSEPVPARDEARLQRALRRPRGRARARLRPGRPRAPCLAPLPRPRAGRPPLAGGPLRGAVPTAPRGDLAARRRVVSRGPRPVRAAGLRADASRAARLRPFPCDPGAPRPRLALVGLRRLRRVRGADPRGAGRALPPVRAVARRTASSPTRARRTGPRGSPRRRAPTGIRPLLGARRLRLGRALRSAARPLLRARPGLGPPAAAPDGHPRPAVPACHRLPAGRLRARAPRSVSTT